MYMWGGVKRTFHIHPPPFGLDAVHVNFSARQNAAVGCFQDHSQSSSVALPLFKPACHHWCLSLRVPHSAVAQKGGLGTLVDSPKINSIECMKI